MKNLSYHILNGDSLKEQFPTSIEGEIIVARECLVDGSVEGESLEEFYETRANFIGSHYAGYGKEDYYKKTASEFEKIQNISADSEIFLWFEDDLFCQVNFWFVASLLKDKKQHNSIFLVRPKEHKQYGFGGLNETELISIYENRISLNDELDEIALLWKYYKQDDTEKLYNTAKKLSQKYPFILPVVEAHKERQPNGKSLGRPKESIIQIMKDLQTKEFVPVFREFTKREAIYGFGDLQVKRLFEEVEKII